MKAKTRMTTIPLLVVTLLLALTACPSGSGSGGGSGPCVPESGTCPPAPVTGGADSAQGSSPTPCPSTYTFDPCYKTPADTEGPEPPAATVSANPAATNPGVGQVTGVCRFTIQGDTGLTAKRMSSVLVEVVGIVYGYCTDVIHDFTIDLHIYAAPTGDAHGDFTKDPNAFEVGSRTAHKPIPGPNKVPYAITVQCLPGLEYQLVYFVTAYDPAGNPIGSRSHPLGGKVAEFSAEECGLSGH